MSQPALTGAGARRQQLGRYELLRHLATGGMAEIYLARARGIEGFEKLVVAKRLLPRAEHDATLIAMFLDEARLAATLHHPNIVQVYDIGVTDDDNYFFTMEFVYGQDLSHVLRRAAALRRQPSFDAALTIILGLCAGLHYAHEKEGSDGRPLGLVHRDVSPQNVLLSYDGNVKIMDFGIAKATTNSQKTRDGTLKGKIAYMSPEQGTSQNIDRRSDVFSLAIMLWELTTFRRLYKAESDFESLRRIIQEDAPRPSRYVASYPPELERIVMKALRRNPAERYQTVEEMQLELEAFAREQRLVISPVSLSRYIRDLFHERVHAWTIAQQAGKSFAEFLVEARQVEEGSAITADTWVAPGTDPSEEEGEPDLLEIEVEPPRRRGRLLGGLMVVALCMAAVAGWRWWEGRDDDAPTTPSPAAAAVKPPATEIKTTTAPAAPDPAPAAASAPTEPAVAAPAEPAPAEPAPAAAAVEAAPAGSATAPVKRPQKPAAKLAVKRVKPAAPATKPPEKTGPKKVDLDSPYPQ